MRAFAKNSNKYLSRRATSKHKARLSAK